MQGLEDIVQGLEDIAQGLGDILHMGSKSSLHSRRSIDCAEFFSRFQCVLGASMRENTPK